jgi:hypothetical protein
MPNGFGGLYRLWLQQSGSIVSASVGNDTVSYVLPTLKSSSLAQKREPYSDTPTDDLELDTSASVNLVFNGSNFVPGNTTVTYGPLPGADRYSCAVYVDLSTSDMISCLSAPDSQGKSPNAAPHPLADPGPGSFPRCAQVWASFLR